ncbi:MAG: Molybdopterin-guanine dinucleotide biosynthesis adapter protein [Promethearchaeota archaeon]|nr:MAG: Molybdopterin-guanine dinucleotide biosynthesis adapter protein [Candidatus Lokiarchaeota archaeon]
MNIINLIGYSGSGKTYLIKNAIGRLKNELEMDSAVIKNIHEHQIDKKGKDSFIYTQTGANYAITKNIYDETTIFTKKPIKIETLIKWLEKGPFNIDVVFIEGFRDVEKPTILCLEDIDNFQEQYNRNVVMISGIFTSKSDLKELENIPVINIEKEFEKFTRIFGLR